MGLKQRFIPPRGFTLLELMVVISIIAIFLEIYVRQAKSSRIARRSQSRRIHRPNSRRSNDEGAQLGSSRRRVSALRRSAGSRPHRRPQRVERPGKRRHRLQQLVEPATWQRRPPVGGGGFGLSSWAQQSPQRRRLRSRRNPC